ncbi:MAG: ATP-dependent Clp protease proteolytic subunit [Candidatus Melainabacteria bacterium]|nr:ATP-dependent Clp protease proteolytic subunit [Candidatus Melainabacteria bacterium]
MRWETKIDYGYASTSPSGNGQHSVPFFNPTIRKPLPGGGEMATDATSELLAQRIVIFAYPFDDTVVTQISNQLLYLDSIGSEDITMYVNSGGGSVTAGFALYDIIQQLRSPVSTIGMGMCGSMGAFLLSTGAAGKRFVLPGTTVMIHQPSYGTDGKITHMAAHMKWATVLYNRLIGTMAVHCNRSFEELEEAMKEDNFLSAEEALALGLIDGIFPAPEGKAYLVPRQPQTGILCRTYNSK